MQPELRQFFEEEGLVRHQLEAEPNGEVCEVAAGPFVCLGPRDSDFVEPPDPETQRYPGPEIGVMSLEDYHVFLYRWIEEAVRAQDVACAYCGKLLRDADDLPDAETWDVVLVEKDLVAWLPLHFDCKRWIPKRIKGLSPFVIAARMSPNYDLSLLSPNQIARPFHG